MSAPGTQLIWWCGICSSDRRSALVLNSRLHQPFCESFVNVKPTPSGMRLVVVAIDRRRAVVNERSDTAGDIPVAISGALVRIVKEAVICVFFVQ